MSEPRVNLTPEERERIHRALYTTDEAEIADGPYTGMLAEVERIVRAREAQAWDEGHERAAHAEDRANHWERKFREAQSEIGQCQQVAREEADRADQAEVELARRDAQESEVDTLEASLEKAEAKVARVEALAEQYEADAAHEGYGGELWSTTGAAIRAALEGDR